MLSLTTNSVLLNTLTLFSCWFFKINNLWFVIVSVFAFQQDEISEDTSCIDLNEHEKMETKVSIPKLNNFVYINWENYCISL